MADIPQASPDADEPAFRSDRAVTGAPLLVITDRKATARPLVDVVAAVLDGGCRWIMVREKDLDAAALRALVGEIVGLADRYGARISVNANAAVARVCGAAGVHLPAGYDVGEARAAFGPGALIGVSAHSLAEARRAAHAGADYVTVSPVFASASKPGYGPTLGLDGLGRIAAKIAVPALALGGVTARTASDCLRAGAAGVAVMGAAMRADDPAAAVSALLAALAR